MPDKKIHFEYFKILNEMEEDLVPIDVEEFHNAIDEPLYNDNNESGQKTKKICHSNFFPVLSRYNLKKGINRNFSHHYTSHKPQPYMKNEMKTLIFHWVNHLIVDVIHNKNSYVEKITSEGVEFRIIRNLPSYALNHANDLLKKMGVTNKSHHIVIEHQIIKKYTQIRRSVLYIREDYEIDENKIDLPLHLKGELLKAQQNKLEVKT